jgi:hypothetical protein
LSDVVIGFFNETWWYLKGESHIDDVLAGEEAAELTISLVICANWAAVMTLWEEPKPGQMPWAINPKIIERLKTRPHTTTGT